MEKPITAADLVRQIVSAESDGQRRTQGWIASKLRVRAKTVSEWATGQVVPRPRNFAKLKRLAERVQTGEADPLDIAVENAIAEIEAMVAAYHEGDREAVRQSLATVIGFREKVRDMLMKWCDSAQPPVTPDC